MLSALRRDRFGPISGVLCGLQILLRRSRHRQDTVGKAPRGTSTARGAPPPISLCAVRSHASPRPHCLVAGDVRGQPGSVLHGAEALVVPHLYRDWARPATSAPGLRSPLPHLHRDWGLPGHAFTARRRVVVPLCSRRRGRRRRRLRPCPWPCPPAQAVGRTTQRAVEPCVVCPWRARSRTLNAGRTAAEWR